jgi:hypothetical protein
LTTDNLHETARLAGFFAAHAIWGLSNGEDLAPLYGFIRHNGLREFTRLTLDTLEAGVTAGRELLSRNEESMLLAVLVYDGYVTLGDARHDAVVIEARRYGNDAEAMEMVVPYRPAGHADGFAVHRPKFVDLARADDRALPLSEAFFRGVNEHREAAPVWRDHMDDRL